MRSQRGEVSLMQLLTAMAIFGFITMATIMVFAASQRLNESDNQRNDTQDNARRTLDRLARELRNLASPNPQQPQAVDLANPTDLVVKVVDPNGPNSGLNSSNVERVRYCVGTTTGTRLYRQEQRWTTATPPNVPSTSACPAPIGANETDWRTSTIVAQDVRNGARPVFTYNSATLTSISSIHAQLFVDTDPTRPPNETTISTGVFLRNQNRAPTAAFTADTTVRGKIILNAGTSSDPEGQPLTYVWYDNTLSSPKVGDGVRFDYSVTPGTTHTLQLKVYDPGNLEGVSTPLSVTAP